MQADAVAGVLASVATLATVVWLGRTAARALMTRYTLTHQSDRESEEFTRRRFDVIAGGRQ